MRGDEDIAGSGFQERLAALEVHQRVRVLLTIGKTEAVGRNRRETVGVDQIQTAPVFAGTPRPTGSTGSVPRREMGSDGNGASAQSVAVLECFDAGDAGDWSKDSKLRIISRNRPAFHYPGGPTACRDSGAA